LYTKFSGCAVLSGACFLLSSCWLNPEAEVEVVEFDQERFDRERAAWNAAGIKNYRFDVHIDAFGDFPIIRYFIENGSFKNRVFIEFSENDYFNDYSFNLVGFTTIPEFYAEIERSVQEKAERI
jgi:hypothetical protein